MMQRLARSDVKSPGGLGREEKKKEKKRQQRNCNNEGGVYVSPVFLVHACYMA
jgi:hypothetical protein